MTSACNPKLHQVKDIKWPSHQYVECITTWETLLSNSCYSSMLWAVATRRHPCLVWATSYKKITRRGELASQIDVFGNLEASHSQITEAGMPVLAMLYGGNLTVSLDHLRYVQYLNLLATSSVRLRPERLPPTTNAAAYHLYRVHCQVAQWKCLSTSALDPLKWGWYAQSDKFWPMTTDLEAAPDDLRRIVKCSCKAGTDRSCVTQTCSCKRHGLPCIPACKHCHGVDCENRHEK